MSDRIKAGFTGPDTDGLFNRGYKNLAIPDASGLRGLANSIDCTFYEIIRQDNLDFDLG